MRWDRLFADLEGRYDELLAADEAAEQRDRERLAAGAVGWTERLAGAVGEPVRVGLAAGDPVAGRLRRVGPDWLLLAGEHAGETLVPLRWVVAVQGLTSATGSAPAGVAGRLDLRRALRGVARDRAAVAVRTLDGAGQTGGVGVGSGVDAGQLTGTIDRVGADFVEVAVHAAGEPRRAANVRAVVLVPLRAVVVVRVAPAG